MQSVSQAWKDNQNETIVSESFVEVGLTLTDPDAFADASAEDNGAIYISNTAQTVSEVDKDIVPYATLEQNVWVLDGKREIIPQGSNILPNSANLTNCTRDGDIFTRTAKVYDSIMWFSDWMPQAGEKYTFVIDVLDDVLSSLNYLAFISDSRFAFEDTVVNLKYGLNYITVKARDNITEDMLGSIWLNSQPTLPSLRFKMSIVPQGGYGDCGYIGTALSNASGDFSTAPILSVNFSEVHHNLIPGITISWGTAYDEYAVDFTITAYNGDTVVATKSVTDNADLKTVVFVDISEYDRITISISKWCLPYRRARIEEVLIGTEVIYSKGDLFSFSHTQEVDPISSALPKSEISFSIDNTDDSYNPNNLNSLAKYLIERQELKARYGYKVNDNIEWIDCGTFYMSEWDAPQGGITADFTARDLLEFMTDTYYKGVYNPEGISLYDLAVAVLQDADLPLEDDGSVKWVIDERLKDIYTVAPLPIDTHANCLQMIANAGGCVLYQDRKGILHIERVINSSTDMIDFGTVAGSTWANNITTDERLRLVNSLTSGKYEMSLTSKLVSKTDDFAEGNNISRVVLELNSGRFKEVVLNWDDDEEIGSTKTATGTIEITDSDIADGFSNIYTYGCGRLQFGKTGSADILNISIGIVDLEYDINHFNSYSKSDITLAKPLKQVDVSSYSYSVAESKTKLYEGVVAINGTVDVLINYSGTATNITEIVSGGTLNSATYYANACVLNITAEGGVTIIVYGYSLETSSVKVVTASGVTGETVTVDNPLITDYDRAVAIGAWVESYMKNRMVLGSEWRADPRLDALDMVDNVNDYNTNKVIMTNVSYTYNGAFRGSGEGRVI